MRAFISTVVCVIAFVINLVAQTPGAYKLKRPGNHEIAFDRSRSTRVPQRFLGWTFANKAKQDTSRWRRGFTPNLVAGENSAHVDMRAAAGTTSAPIGFAFPSSLPTGYLPTAVASGDFNEDGKMDVAISNGGDNSVFVLLGNGDGTFQVPEVLYTRGQSPDWITAAKLSASGHLDLIVSNGDSQTIEVFNGKGDGTFTPGTVTSLSEIPTFVLRGDFNNDGKDDIAVGLAVNPGTGPQFEVLLGNGAGGFASTVVPPLVENTGDSPVPTGWLEPGDVDNNGFLDLVVTVTGGNAGTYLNLDGNSFSQGPFFGPYDGATVVGLGDLDEDGCLDAIEPDSLGLLTIAKGNCDGTFASVLPQYEIGDIDVALKMMDIDGDGHLDLVASGAWWDGFVPNTVYGDEAGYLVSVMKGDGKGHLQPASVYRANGDMFSFTVADFNGDGKPDLIAPHPPQSTSTYLPGMGNGQFDVSQGACIGFTPGATNSIESWDVAHVLDLNGDHHPDLVLVQSGEHGGPSTFSAMLNDGTGHFLPPIKSPITVGDKYPYSTFVTGDFRSTGKQDIVYLSIFGTQSLALFPNNGDGSFGAPVAMTPPDYPLGIVAADFNHDGKLDVAVYGIPFHTWQVTTYLGNGDGTFAQQPTQDITFSEANGIEQMFAGDFNHDGKPDLLIRLDTVGDYLHDDLLELLGNGDGTFQSPTLLKTHFGVMTVSDVNKDGYLDLIQEHDPANAVVDPLTGSYLAAITVYLGQADGSFASPKTIRLTGAMGGAPLLGDFNGDGKMDIALKTWPGVGLYARFNFLQGNGDGTFIASNQIILPDGSLPSAVGDLNGDGLDDLVEIVGFTSSYDTINAVRGPALNLALSSSPILPPRGYFTLTLASPATAATDVAITTDSPGIFVPASIHFDAGQQVKHFTITVGTAYKSSHAIHLIATLGSESSEVTAGLRNPDIPVGVQTAIAWGLYGISSLAVVPGQQLQLQWGLSSEGGYSGSFRNFTCTADPETVCDLSNYGGELLPGGNIDTDVHYTAPSSLGSHPLMFSTTDGETTVSIGLPVNVEGYSLSSPHPILSIPPTGYNFFTLKATAPPDLGGNIQITCAGLPSGASCDLASLLLGGGSTTTFTVSGNALSPKDYPFKVVGTLGTYSSSMDATLRVGDFGASFDKNAVTMAVGQTSTFQMTFKSINHYASTITLNVESEGKAGVDFTVDPSIITLSDGGTTTATLKIKLTSFTQNAPSRASRLPVGALTLGALPMFVFLRRRFRLISLTLLAFLMSAFVSCGGGGGSNGGGTNPPPSTAQLKVSANAAPPVIGSPNNIKDIGTITITLQ